MIAAWVYALVHVKQFGSCYLSVCRLHGVPDSDNYEAGLLRLAAYGSTQVHMLTRCNSSTTVLQQLVCL